MKYTGKPVMKSALWSYESAAVAAHEIPPDGGTKAARCAAYSAFTGVKSELANFPICRGTPYFANASFITQTSKSETDPANAQMHPTAFFYCKMRLLALK